MKVTIGTCKGDQTSLCVKCPLLLPDLNTKKWNSPTNVFKFHSSKFQETPFRGSRVHICIHIGWTEQCWHVPWRDANIQSKSRCVLEFRFQKFSNTLSATGAYLISTYSHLSHIYSHCRTANHTADTTVNGTLTTLQILQWMALETFCFCLHLNIRHIKRMFCIKAVEHDKIHIMVLTAMITNSSSFLAATTCNPKLTNISVEQTPEFYFLPVFSVFFFTFLFIFFIFESCILLYFYSLLLKTEGISSFETSADIYKTTLHYIPEYRIPKIQSFTCAVFF
jgi:hypothetical protein